MADKLGNIDINEVKEIAKDINYLNIIKVLGTFDKKKAKDVLNDVDFKAALKAAKAGDIKELEAAFDGVDLNELKDLIDRDGDGDIKDDINDIIKMLKK